MEPIAIVFMALFFTMLISGITFFLYKAIHHKIQVLPPPDNQVDLPQ